MEHITMPRGDLRNIHFTVHDANDTSARKIIIQKKLTDGTITKDGNVYSFSIRPEDTDYIDFGTYYYDIELIRGDQIHQTFVGKLIITEEVTFACDTEKGV